MVPLLKYGQNLNESLRRMEKKLSKMNPSDFKYKFIKSRFESLKSAFLSYRVMFENKLRQSNINKFYYKLLEQMISKYQ